MKELATTRVLLIAAIIIVSGVVGAYFLWPRPKTGLIVSTTTSLYETGFLDVLKKNFEQKNPGFNVSFISQGTGAAIQTAKVGQADMVLVHDPTAEFAFLNESWGVNRKIVAYNFFIIVGPSNDPAGIKGLSVIDAMKKIKTCGDSQPSGTAVWVSRGDNSGTHSAEKRLWTSAGFNPIQIRTNSWYLEAGTGMTATLALANQKNAYTLCDLGSYIANFNKGNIQLAKLVEGSVSELLNVYCVIPCNPQKLPNAKFEGAMALTKYLISNEGQALFNSFTNTGIVMFKPWIPVLKSGTPADIKQWVINFAYFKDSTGTLNECPTLFRYNAGDLYS